MKTYAVEERLGNRSRPQDLPHPGTGNRQRVQFGDMRPVMLGVNMDITSFLARSIYGQSYRHDFRGLCCRYVSVVKGSELTLERVVRKKRKSNLPLASRKREDD